MGPQIWRRLVWVGLLVSFIGACFLWRSYSKCRIYNTSPQYFYSNLWMLANVALFLSITFTKSSLLVLAFSLFAVNLTSDTTVDYDTEQVILSKFSIVSLDYFGFLRQQSSTPTDLKQCLDYYITGASLSTTGTGLAIIGAAALLSSEWTRPEIGASKSYCVRIMIGFIYPLFLLGGLLMLQSMPRYSDSEFLFRIFTLSCIECSVACLLVFNLAYFLRLPSLDLISIAFNTLFAVQLFGEMLTVKYSLEYPISNSHFAGFIMLWLSLVFMALFSVFIHEDTDPHTAAPPPYYAAERIPLVARAVREEPPPSFTY